MTSPYARPSPRYFGFDDPDPDLYEFRTDTGVYVYLHELECIGIEYGPLTRTLKITFDGGPTDLVPAMTVALAFTDAEVFQWRSTSEPLDQAVVDTNPRVRGQVGAFDSMREGPKSPHRGVSFHLSLSEVELAFFASTVRCEVSSDADGPA